MLAFVSRSESESVLAIGPFGNHVIDLLAYVAIVFLAAAIYTPVLQESLKFAPIPIGRLAGVAAMVAAITALGAVVKTRRGVTATGK